MDNEIERLRNALAEAERRHEETQRRNEETQRRHEETQRRHEETQRRLEESKRRLEESKRRLEESERQRQRTTLAQFLTTLHNIFLALKVQREPSKSSGGGNTSVSGRYYPRFLQPWGEEFVQSQRSHFEVIQHALGDEQLFPSLAALEYPKGAIIGAAVACEEDLKPFEQFAIEMPVQMILDALIKRAGTSTDVSQVLQPFRFTRVAFANHAYKISVEPFLPPAELDFLTNDAGDGESSERSEGQNEGQQEPARGPRPTKKLASGRVGSRIIPDRRCIREDAAGGRSVAFVIDYKAAHKAPTDELQRSLSEENLVTNVIKQATSIKSTADKEQAGEERTERIVAMMLTQMFHYMIELGLEYSYVTTGKAIVLLRIKENDPSTLYYALVAPDKGKEGEAGGEVDAKKEESDTAVAQAASFCLMALQSSKRSQTWVTAAQNSLCQWPILYPEAGCQATGEESSQSSQSTSSSDQSFKAPQPSDFVPLSTRKLRPRSTCNPGAGIGNVRRDDSDDDHMSRDPTTSAAGGSRTESKQKEAPSSSSGSRASSGAFSETGGRTTRQYCTQACLLGLKRGGRLDEACPNVAAHRAAATAGNDQHHPIQAAELAGLLREQLSQDMEQNIQPLEPRGKHGARGTLFKLTLAPYGYTFVGKGTVIDNVRYFLHESKVYSRLERLQGDVIPVHLGNIDLAVPYRMMAWNSYYFTGAQIVHMLLMSWAGEEAAAQKMSEPDLEAEATRLSRVLRTEGVCHGDEREANILWSEELHRVMFIDFDRAALMLPPKPKLIKTLSRTKKRKLRRSPRLPQTCKFEATTAYGQHEHGTNIETTRTEIHPRLLHLPRRAGSHPPPGLPPPGEHLTVDG